MSLSSALSLSAQKITLCADTLRLDFTRGLSVMPYRSFILQRVFLDLNAMLTSAGQLSY